MLKLAARPPVRFELDISGERIQITARGMGRVGIQDWLDANRETPIAKGVSSLIESWDGVADQEGNPVPVSRSAVSLLLDSDEGVFENFVAAYIKAATEESEKN